MEGKAARGRGRERRWERKESRWCEAKQAGLESAQVDRQAATSGLGEIDKRPRQKAKQELATEPEQRE